MKIIALLLIVLMQFVFIYPQKTYAATNTVNLLTADHFALLAGAADADANLSTIVGDVGLRPASGSFIGVKCSEVTGTIYDDDGAYTGGGGGSTLCRVTNDGLLNQAKLDLTTAYGDAAGRTPTTTFVAGDNQLGGQTLTSGVYKFGHATSANVVGTLTLDAQGNPNAVFIFQASSDLITASSSVINLVNGAQACNVFWQVSTSATLGTGSNFVGTIMADQSITDSGGSTVNGRFLASVATVTVNNTHITKSTCSTTTTTTATNASAASGQSSAGTSACIANPITTVPIIIDSRRISPTSVFVSWGPYAGINTFNVRYGLANGTWLYNTNVTGFSTTINALPPNQPIWIEIAATNNCSIGTYGEPKLVGGPSLPNTGFAPHQNNISWYMPVGIGVTVLALLVLIQKKYRFFV